MFQNKCRKYLKRKHNFVHLYELNIFKFKVDIFQLNMDNDLACYRCKWSLDQFDWWLTDLIFEFNSWIWFVSTNARVSKWPCKKSHVKLICKKVSETSLPGKSLFLQLCGIWHRLVGTTVHQVPYLPIGVKRTSVACYNISRHWLLPHF